MENSEADKDLKLIEFEFLARPSFEVSNGCEAATSQEGKQQEDRKEGGGAREENCRPVAASKEYGILVEDEENDGYQTPTSSEQKIPASRKCPPAPKKPRSLPVKKRKACFDSCHITVEIYEELESIFRPKMQGSLYKIKKARKGDMN